MKKIIDFFKKLWNLIFGHKEETPELGTYTPLEYDTAKVIAILELCKDAQQLLKICKKYGVENSEELDILSDNKTKEAIKDQLYDLIYFYETEGANDNYIKLINERIDMFKQIKEINDEEKAEREKELNEQ